ncbi:MAG: nucleotidyltransferase domain-containing protein [Chloroflexota bacterium]|nr:nucleotidyltransferase domain-containing protein [Chloroflexota bacterium]
MSETTKTILPEDKIREYCATQPIRRLSVFGSALRNELTPESDIDLLVEYLPDARIGYFELAQQEIDLSELIGGKVDLRTPNELSRLFRQEVIENARLLYVRAS